MTIEPLTVKIIKGFTKTQSLLFTLLACADVDLQNSDSMDILRPLFHVLDKAWLVPCHAAWQKMQTHQNHKKYQTHQTHV